MKKKTNRRSILWMAMPFLLLLPMAAAGLAAWGRWGQLIRDAVSAAVKVVVRP